ncbi:MAG: zinc-ribbon domain-containing protein [Pseudomonadota bacterium]
MIVTCPECATRYDVADEAFSSGGRAVRCNHCGCEWYQIGPSEAGGPGAEGAAPPREAAGFGADAAYSSAETYASGEPPRIAATRDAPAMSVMEDRERARLPLGVGPADVRAPRRSPGGARRPRGARRPGGGRSLASVLTPILGAGAVAAAAVVGVVAFGGFNLDDLSSSVAAVSSSDGAAYTVAPRTVDADGVVFVEHKYDLVERAEGPALEVWGRVANNGEESALSPTIEVISRNSEGVALQRWLAQPEVESLGPGESAKFSSRMMYPLGPVHSVDFFIAAR